MASVPITSPFLLIAVIIITATQLDISHGQTQSAIDYNACKNGQFCLALDSRGDLKTKKDTDSCIDRFNCKAMIVLNPAIDLKVTIDFYTATDDGTTRTLYFIPEGWPSTFTVPPNSTAYDFAFKGASCYDINSHTNFRVERCPDGKRMDKVADGHQRITHGHVIDNHDPRLDIDLVYNSLVTVILYVDINDNNKEVKLQWPNKGGARLFGELPAIELPWDQCQSPKDDVFCLGRRLGLKPANDQFGDISYAGGQCFLDKSCTVMMVMMSDTKTIAIDIYATTFTDPPNIAYIDADFEFAKTQIPLPRTSKRALVPIINIRTVSTGTGNTKCVRYSNQVPGHICGHGNNNLKIMKESHNNAATNSPLRWSQFSYASEAVIPDREPTIDLMNDLLFVTPLLKMAYWFPGAKGWKFTNPPPVISNVPKRLFLESSGPPTTTIETTTVDDKTTKETTTSSPSTTEKTTTSSSSTTETQTTPEASTTEKTTVEEGTTEQGDKTSPTGPPPPPPGNGTTVNGSVVNPPNSTLPPSSTLPPEHTIDPGDEGGTTKKQDEEKSSLIWLWIALAVLLIVILGAVAYFVATKKTAPSSAAIVTPIPPPSAQAVTVPTFTAVTRKPSSTQVPGVQAPVADAPKTNDDAPEPLGDLRSEMLPMFSDAKDVGYIPNERVDDVV